MNRTSVLVIDDEPQILKLLSITLESNGYKVLLSETGSDGMLMIGMHAPDIIILDLGLPDINGHDVLLKVREDFSRPIIILSVQDSEEDIVKALDNGATDYLTKPFRTGELLARIRSAMRSLDHSEGKSHFQFDNIEIDLDARTVQKNGESIKLTSTEYKLLVLFANNQGKALTHQYILNEVWGFKYKTETQYLRVFVGTLRKKIEDNPNKPQHIITESGVGYRFQ